jgi:hypothetical protein
MSNPIIDAAKGKSPDAALFEQDKQYRAEYLGSLLESYRMAMAAIARLEEKVSKQDEAIAKLESDQDARNALVSDKLLPIREFFVWHSTTRGREYELVGCRELVSAIAYGQNRYGIDFLNVTEAG